ncbi:unnamed protein product [Adineta steineri]|uniref:Uncharacterized protein n=1 Tax=Adineta steineri TaxID=433720 RepID=A0A815SX36_9BILA|nr:unnamed protein product [Adineta steineri]
MLLNKFKSEKTYRVLMLGLEQAGKTTLLYKIKLGETVDTIPTVGFNIETIKPADNIIFDVWDGGGAKKYRPIMRYYFQNCDGFFFIVDSTDRDHFQEARDVLFNILQDEYMDPVPFVVIANKSDLCSAAKSDEIIEQLNLHSISNRSWHFQSTSAVNGEGISDAMRQLAHMIRTSRKK